MLGPQNDIVTHRQALPHKDVAAARCASIVFACAAWITVPSRGAHIAPITIRPSRSLMGRALVGYDVTVTFT